MAWSDAGKILRAEASAGFITHLSLHSADPGTTGANEVSGNGYARLAPNYGSASIVGAVAECDLVAELEFDTPSEQSVPYLGSWQNTTWLGAWARASGDPAANVDGKYTVASAKVRSF